MIEARGLVKHYRSARAVDNLSFDVQPGTVTGFLGPNGAGKSTTMRMIMGLDRPDGGRSGSAGGVRRPALAAARGGRAAGGEGVPSRPHRPRPPDRAGGQQPDRPAAGRGGAGDHRHEKAAGRGPGSSRSACPSGSASPPRCLATPGCCCSTSRSTAWTPRASAGSATAEGPAAQGRTVLVSSHLISEIAHTADQLIVIGQGGCSPRPRSPELSARSGSLEEAFFR